MSFLDEIAVLILTFNEEANIGRTLEALKPFPEIVVVDSGSSDKTAEIVAKYANARMAVRAFDSHASQWTFGLRDCGIERRWVLALDADYVVSGDLVAEISRLPDVDAVSGYDVSFDYCVFGRKLSGTLYPKLTALYRRDRARYIQSGHTQRIVVDGPIKELHARISHDDRKSLARWFTSQQRYAKLEADYLAETPAQDLRRTDRIRRIGWPAPLLVFFYTLLAKRCILDGPAGWYYVLQRTLAETMIALEISDRSLRRRADV